MSRYQLIHLKDIANSQTGPFGSQLHQSDYVTHGTPMVTVEHLGVERFTHQNLPFVSDKDRDRLSKYILTEGDIVFSRVGSVDRCTYVTKEEEGWMFSGRCIRVRVNSKANGRYLNFYFRQESFKKMMMDISVGATMPSLNTKLMDNIQLSLPNINIQKQIAKVLSDLDAKIEINNKINQELEAMTKTLYDYWFVQFDFPDANGKPYKSSGGLMVFNEELKREIPERWECYLLGDLGNFKNGVNYDPSKPGDVACPIINVRNISKSRYFLKNEDLDVIYLKESDVRKYAVHEDSIIIARSGIPGATRLIADYEKNTLYCGFAIHYQLEKSDQKSLIFFYLKSIEEIIKNGSGGTILKNVNQATLNNLKVALPKSDEIIDLFNKKINPIFSKINLIQKENQKLSELRDWLLPMLMNGQVRVGQAKKEMEHLQMAAEPQTNYGKENSLHKTTPNPYHPMANIIGIHIAKSLEDSEGMGRTKFQKVLHLTEYHCKTVLGGLYYQKTAGPHNDILLQHVEGKFRQYGHIKISEDRVHGNRHIVYKTTHNTLEYEAAYEDNLSDNYRAKLEGVLAVLKPLSLKQAEAISTLYAVWNNRIIEGKTTEEEELIKDFYNWSSRKRKEFEDVDIINAMSTMKKHDITPDGWGDYIAEKVD